METRYRPVNLGDPGPGSVKVSIFDENGRPFPDVPISLVINGPPQTEEVHSVGPTGETVIEIPTHADGPVIIAPHLDMNFASSPPFLEIVPGEEKPAEISFMVARRSMEKDYLTPIVTFVVGGLLTGGVLWLINRIK